MDKRLYNLYATSKPFFFAFCLISPFFLKDKKFELKMDIYDTTDAEHSLIDEEGNNNYDTVIKSWFTIIKSDLN